MFMLEFKKKILMNKVKRARLSTAKSSRHTHIKHTFNHKHQEIIFQKYVPMSNVYNDKKN